MPELDLWALVSGALTIGLGFLFKKYAKIKKVINLADAIFDAAEDGKIEPAELRRIEAAYKDLLNKV